MTGSAGRPIEPYHALDCFTASYGTAVMRAGGNPVVLGDEWGFQWREGVNATSPIDRLSMSRRQPEEKLRHWYGLEPRSVVHDSVEAAWSYVGEVVADREPVIVALDSFYLPYSPHYHSLHFPHRILVVNRSQDTAGIVDSYQGAPFTGELPAKVVLEAMSAVGRHNDAQFDVQAQHRTVDLRGQSVERSEPDPAKVLAALECNAAAYLDGPAPTGGDPGSPVLHGREALRRAAQELRAGSDTRLPAAASTEILAWFGALASQRAANAGFLREAARILLRPELGSLAKLAAHSSQAWLVTRNLYYIRAGNLPGTISRLADRMDALADADHELSQQVRQALAGHGGEEDEGLAYLRGGSIG